MLILERYRALEPKPLRVILHIFVIILFSSCIVQREINKQEVLGKYKLNREGYAISETIELNGDHTFEYIWVAGLNSGVTKGTWTLDENEIIFISNLREFTRDNIVHDVVKKKGENKDSVLVKIVDTKKEPLMFAKCLKMKDSSIRSSGFSDVNGLIKFSKSPADSLVIRSVDFGSVQIPWDAEASYYEITIWRIPLHYRYFESEKWVFKKGRLYDTTTENNVIKKEYYEKVE